MKMRTVFSLVIVLFVMSILNTTTSHAQDFSRWGLPDGAEARLGKGVINAIAYSLDGSRLAVGASTGIWIYDAETGEELSLLGAHTGVVSSIAVAMARCSPVHTMPMETLSIGNTTWLYGIQRLARS